MMSIYALHFRRRIPRQDGIRLFSEIASSDSLNTVREHFKMASEEAEKLATGKDGYYVFTCPMAKADWVQKTTKVQNPYMGSDMSGCGSLKSGKSSSMPAWVAAAAVRKAGSASFALAVIPMK